MTKVLIAYFSLTGHTQQVADAIVTRLHADREPIIDQAGRTFSPSHMVWFAMESLMHQMPEIRPLEHDPSEYDVVVIGTPVWAGNVATPVRTFVDRYKAQFNRIALFCTEGGANGEHALDELAALAEAPSLARLVITEQEVTSGAYRAKVATFCDAIAGVPA